METASSQGFNFNRIRHTNTTDANPGLVRSETTQGTSRVQSLIGRIQSQNNQDSDQFQIRRPLLRSNANNIDTTIFNSTSNNPTVNTTNVVNNSQTVNEIVNQNETTITGHQTVENVPSQSNNLGRDDCVVCYDTIQPMDKRFFDCFHFVCENCNSNLDPRICPICRMEPSM